MENMEVFFIFLFFGSRGSYISRESQHLVCSQSASRLVLLYVEHVATRANWRSRWPSHGIPITLRTQQRLAGFTTKRKLEFLRLCLSNQCSSV